MPPPPPDRSNNPRSIGTIARPAGTGYSFREGISFMNNQSLSNLRTLLQALADQLDDADDDRTAMSQTAHGRMVASYLVAQSASPEEQGRAAEAITQVMAVRLETVRGAIGVVDALAAELAKGEAIDYRQIPGIEELL